MVPSMIKTAASLCTRRTNGSTKSHQVLAAGVGALGKRVIWSWLKRPSTSADKPVAVTGPIAASR